MRNLLYLACFLAFSQLSAQPLPLDSLKSERGHFVFAVFQQTSPAEAIVWHSGSTSLTTHRLLNGTDSTQIALRPVPYPVLRTYMTTEKHLGAAAGAEMGIIERGEVDLKDLLHYPALLSPAQRQLTESYLAVKHGLTLDQTRPVNYLARDGEFNFPVWTATAEPDFRFRIVGLARDNQSGLDRREGSSVLAPDLLYLGWPERPTTTAYLLLADDGKPLARTPGAASLQRTWRVETTGTAPKTTLTLAGREFFDRVRPGETWQLTLRHGAEATVYSTTATTDAQLVFSDLAFPADSVSYLSLTAPTSAPIVPAESFFTNVSLSPNPVAAGQSVQLRAALIEASTLRLSVVDVSGRLLEERRLTPTSHHLTEIVFPAPGSYTLHLRSRPNSAKPQRHTLKVVVQ